MNTKTRLAGIVKQDNTFWGSSPECLTFQNPVQRNSCQHFITMRGKRRLNLARGCDFTVVYLTRASRAPRRCWECRQCDISSHQLRPACYQHGVDGLTANISGMIMSFFFCVYNIWSVRKIPCFHLSVICFFKIAFFGECLYVQWNWKEVKVDQLSTQASFLWNFLSHRSR